MTAAPHSLKVVLVEPEIPHNTGAIGRSCLALEAKLHLVHPLGLQLSEEQLRRSGLDYWPRVEPVMHDCLEDCLAGIPASQSLWLFSTKAERSIFDVGIQPDSWLMFGPESRGLSAELLADRPAQVLKIPMPGEHVRSLNLANAVSVALYEAWRQQLGSTP